MLERSQLSGEVQLAVLEGLLEAGHELSAKDATKHIDGEKKSRARFYPLRVIETQPARRNDTMHMGVQTKPLVPSVQHTEKADLCAEVSRIASDFEKGFRAGA